MGAIVLTYAISEVLIGMGMNSVTLVADGFHNFADAGGFAIAIAANIAQANAHDEAKAEWIGNMGGFANCSVTMLLTCFAGFEAFCRLFVAPHTYEDAHIGPMYFTCAICGMCINGFGAIFLGGHGHSHGGVPCQSHGSPVPTFDHVSASAEDAEEKGLLGGDGHAHCHSHGHTHEHSHDHSHGSEPCIGHAGFQEADKHGQCRQEAGKSEDSFDINVYAMWLHTLQDAVGSLIVLVCGLMVAYSGWPNAEKVDSIGGLIVCTLVWLTSAPVWWQCLKGLLRTA